MGLLWLGRKNTVLDQLCGRRPDYQRLTPRLWHSRKSRSSAGPMLSRLKPSNNLPQIGDIVAVDVDRHDLPAVLLAPASGTWCLYPWVWLEHVSKIPHGSADLGRAACRTPEASDMLQHRGEPTRTGDSFEEAKIAAFELLAERAEHGQAPRGDALVRCPADKVPANPLRRFKKRCAAKILQNLGAAAVALGGSLRKISCPPGPLEYTGRLGSTGQPSAPIAVE